MIPEKENELNFSYHALCQHMIWRRGHTEETLSQKEISKALSIAAGAILDYIACDVRLNISESALKSCENALKHTQSELDQQEAITKSTMLMLSDARKEIRHLKSILAGHHIKYKASKK